MKECTERFVMAGAYIVDVIEDDDVTLLDQSMGGFPFVVKINDSVYLWTKLQHGISTLDAREIRSMVSLGLFYHLI